MKIIYRKTEDKLLGNKQILLDIKPDEQKEELKERRKNRERKGNRQTAKGLKIVDRTQKGKGSLTKTLDNMNKDNL